MNLLIVGAGGLGRELFSWLSQEIKNKPEHKIIGFLDDNLSGLDNYSYPVKIVSTIKDYQPKEDEQLVLAIMEPKIKKQVVRALISKGANFYTFIHSTAIIGHNVKIGSGCIIDPHCVLYCDITVGDFVFISTSSVIGHDIDIGSYTSININSTIAGNNKIGSCCMLGVGAKTIPHREIGDNCIIGAGSVITKNIPSNAVAFGVPAAIQRSQQNY